MKIYIKSNVIRISQFHIFNQIVTLHWNLLCEYITAPSKWNFIELQNNQFLTKREYVCKHYVTFNFYIEHNDLQSTVLTYLMKTRIINCQVANYPMRSW